MGSLVAEIYLINGMIEKKKREKLMIHGFGAGTRCGSTKSQEKGIFSLISSQLGHDGGAPVILLSLVPDSVCLVSVTAFTGLKTLSPSPLWVSHTNWLSDLLARAFCRIKTIASFSVHILELQLFKD